MSCGENIVSHSVTDGRKHRGFVVDRMKIIGVSLGDGSRRKNKFAITFQCEDDLPQLRKLDRSCPAKGISEEEHQAAEASVVDLLNGWRNCLSVSLRPSMDEELLAKIPPEIVLELEGEVPITSLLLKAKASTFFKILQIALLSSL